MARNKANEEIRTLKKIYKVAWSDVIEQSGFSEGYFYNLLRTEMEPEYREIVINAINKARDNSESPEKQFRADFSKVVKGLDLNTKKQMIGELTAILEKYQEQGRQRFNKKSVEGVHNG